MIGHLPIGLSGSSCFGALFIMITLIGAGHVFSIKEAIKYLIYQRKPHAVCVELDKVRFEALENQVDRYEDAPFIMKRLQKIYDKAADISGGELGEEMMGAVEAARELDIPHFFIDMKMNGRAGDIVKDLSVPQIIKLAGSVIGTSVLPKKQMKKALKKVEDDPDTIIKQMEKEFPTLKKNLIDNRNDHMVRNILRINRVHPHVLAVVGAAHLEGMINSLPREQIEVIRLKEIKKIAERISNNELRYVEHGKESGNCKTSYSFDIHAF